MIDRRKLLCYSLTFAGKLTKTPVKPNNYRAWRVFWFVRFSWCFFCFFGLCQNFFYFSQSPDTFSEIDIHVLSNIF